MADRKKRPQGPSFTTPRGTFRYPKLSEIDFGTEEYPAPDGKYSVELILKADAQSTQDFIAKLRPLHEQAIAKADTKFKALKAETRKKLKEVKVNELFTELLDKETEEPTGELSFKFSTKASGQYGKGSKKEGQYWDKRPTVFNADTSKLIEGFKFRDRADDETLQDVHKRVRPVISGGTEGKVSFEVGVDEDGDPGYFISGTGAAGLKLELTAAQVLKLVEGGDRSTAEDYGFGDESDSEDMPADETVGSGEADF
jgi:hypothetical protein